MSLPRYVEYKDSGIEWLGAVPTHWAIAAFKRLIEIQNGADHKSVEANEGFPVYGSGGLFAYASSYLYDGESVLLGRKGTIDRPLYVTGKFWTVDTMYWTKISPTAYGKFCYYLAASIPFSYYATKTALPSMTQSVISAHLVAFPGKEEQIAIATFLDRETAKIDALIADQEKLIALLAEKRQATISHAVTKGLNPDVPMKDSGVAWLGEVPEHWKVGKAGFYVSVLPGYAFSSAEFSQNPSDIRLLRGVNVAVGELRWDEVVYWKRSESDGLDPFDLKAGDVVIGMDRPLISTGMRVARVKQEDLPCLLLQRVAKIQPSPAMDARFIMRLLDSQMFEAHFAPETTGVSVPHISGEQILSFVTPIPDINEQRKICDFLEKEILKIEVLNRESEQAIALLKERRSALITAAVTGQIDVRNLAQEIPA